MKTRTAAVLLALLATIGACDAGDTNCTAADTDEATTGEPEAPVRMEIGERCNVTQGRLCVDGAQCLEPGGYCSRQCWDGHPAGPCEQYDRASPTNKWERFSCVAWPDGSDRCYRESTSEDYDGPNPFQD